MYPKTDNQINSLLEGKKGKKNVAKTLPFFPLYSKPKHLFEHRSKEKKKQEKGAGLSASNAGPMWCSAASSKTDGTEDRTE